MTSAQIPTRTVQIRVGDDGDRAFFLEIEEQTTWENLPHDKRHMERAHLSEKLRETLEILLAAPENVLFIADDAQNGEKMGLLWLGTRFNAITGELEAWIYNLTVLPQFQGCGVGKKLMEHAENYARDNGFCVIGLAVATHNERAQKLYARLNYQASNVLMRKILD